MRLTGSELELSATDLFNFLGCRHRTALDMAAALGKRPYAPKEDDPLLEILWKRGLEHEKAYVESLKAKGCAVTDLREYDNNRDVHVEKTLEAMRAGADVIVQGALRDGRWFGKPDVLRRIAPTSILGAWSYEVIDTKLARETKAGTILQLGLYSEMLALAQGVRPEHFHVVTPYGEHTYRLDDYAAYFRMVRSQMLATADLDPDDVAATYYPEPVSHCQICHWSGQCDHKRREDDHLSLVAGIPRLHRRELETYGVKTLGELAAVSVPFPEAFKPKRGSVETFVRFREQARLQRDPRGKAVPLFELRQLQLQIPQRPLRGHPARDDKTPRDNKSPDEGLCRLPEPRQLLDATGDDLITGEPVLLRVRAPSLHGRWHAPYHLTREFVGWGKWDEPYDGYFQEHPEIDPARYEGAFALEFTPLSALVDLPLRYDPKVQFWSGHSASDGELLFETELTITFGEFLHAIFWEVGFLGSPSERDKTQALLRERAERIDRREHTDDV